MIGINNLAALTGKFLNEIREDGRKNVEKCTKKEKFIWQEKN
jgi:hypothetical protein